MLMTGRRPPSFSPPTGTLRLIIDMRMQFFRPWAVLQTLTRPPVRPLSRRPSQRQPRAGSSCGAGAPAGPRERRGPAAPAAAACCVRRGAIAIRALRVSCKARSCSAEGGQCMISLMVNSLRQVFARPPPRPPCSDGWNKQPCTATSLRRKSVGICWRCTSALPCCCSRARTLKEETPYWARLLRVRV